MKPITIMITILFCYIVTLHIVLHVRISTIEEYLNKSAVPLCENVNDVGPCVKGIK